MYLFKRGSHIDITVSRGIFTNKQLMVGNGMYPNDRDKILKDTQDIFDRYREVISILHHDIEKAGCDHSNFRNIIHIGTDLIDQFEQIYYYTIEDIIVFVSENHGKKYVFAPGHDYSRLIIKTAMPDGNVKWELHNDVFRGKTPTPEQSINYDIRNPDYTLILSYGSDSCGTEYILDMPDDAHTSCLRRDNLSTYNWLVNGIWM